MKSISSGLQEREFLSFVAGVCIWCVGVLLQLVAPSSKFFHRSKAKV